MSMRVQVQSQSLAAVVLAAVAAAQPVPVSSPTKLVSQLDFIQGLGTVTSVGAVAMDASGSWAAEIDTDNPDPGKDEAILVDGLVEIQEGDAVPAIIGASVRGMRLYGLQLGSPVWHAFLSGAPASRNSALMFGDTVLLREGDELQLAGFGPGTAMVGVRGATVSGDQILISAVVDDPAVFGPAEDAIIGARFDASGLIAPSVVAETNDKLGPGEQVRQLLSAPGRVTLDSSGGAGFVANTVRSFEPSRWVLADGGPLARSGQASPAGAAWHFVDQPAVGLNGPHTATLGELSDGRRTLVAASVIATEGHPVPVSAGAPLRAIAPVGPLLVDSRGGVLWWGHWASNEPDTDSALFRNRAVLVQEGVTSVGQQRIDHIETAPGSIAGTPSGSRVVFRARLDLSGATGAFMIEVDTCYADCDGSSTLDIFDFICFQDAFVGAHPYADCTGDAEFDIFDFICFQDAFVIGCP